MIRSLVIDDEQHCIDALVADLSKNCSNVEVAAKCVSGKVEMSVNDVLLDADLAEGWVLTCTGHPVSSDVVLKI